MINASMAIRDSNDYFEKNYKSEIKFIEDKIWEVVYEGFRSVWIGKEEGTWFGENEEQTQRLITHFIELGFKIRIIKDGVGNMSMWRNNCAGIEISWG